MQGKLTSSNEILEKHKKKEVTAKIQFYNYIIFEKYDEK